VSANEGSREGDESVNADAGAIENVSMAATIAEERESLEKVLESMASALSQL